MLKKFPDTIIIIQAILLVFIALTWLIPAGEFSRVEIDGRMIIEPGTFTKVDPSPQGLGAFFMAPIKGFMSAAQIIAFVFLVGGAFTIVTRTGAIDAGLQYIIRLSEKHPHYKNWVLPLMITLFSLGGATFGMSEETLVFVLITIPLALTLGYDSIVGVAITFVGAGVGFAGAFINPFTIGIAQGIAELTPASGMGYRIVVWLVMTTLAIVYIMRYAHKIEKKPEASLVHNIDQSRDQSLGLHSDNLELTRSRKLVLMTLMLTLIGLVVGVSYLGWYINEISGLFIGMGMVASLVSRLSADDTIKAFVAGAKDMMTAALIIGLAKGLVVVAEDGKIIDTILNGIAGGTRDFPAYVNVQVMFAFQSFLNFFVPSGSGQAALTMPIMAPLSDLLGISRQTAVLAYQFGDGLSNMVIPTSGILMGVLSIARVPYHLWMKWMLPLFLILTLVAMLMLLPPILMFEW